MGGSKFREENGAAGSGRAQAGGGSNEDSSSSSMAEGRSGEALHLDNSGSLSPSPCPCPSPSPSCCDTDDDDPGPKPAELYGKFTWRIENFSQISKRELRSNVFEVGGYKWYILVYPQGCDVCNHLSLFLCVADYDKLLPGWSHFAQFTIAVVNKDPKKSKYSDTLHRFCKKEHDWGWKKFMEVSKVLDGFTMADTLVIKAQVQVIRENPNRPFRCLDCHYRRELVRVYITNVEAICRRFVEEKREKLGKFIEDTARWSSFRTFWLAVEENVQRCMSREKTDVILKQVVKRFFNEKEVTSTLVMDALYSGYKSIEYQSTNKKGKIKIVELEDISTPVVCVEKDMFVLADDVLSLLERAATEVLPPLKDDKGPQNRTKDGSSGDEFGRDSVDCDEKCLTELGRRTVEMFVLAHLFSTRVEVAYREAIALRRQEELIREEEAASQAEIELRAKREAADKEKRSKKKQAKQRRSIRKEKDRVRNDKRDMDDQHQHQQEILSGIRNVENCSSKESSLAALEILETPDESEFSGLDKTDNVVGVIGPETEDGDVNRVDWDRDSSEAQQDMEASFSGAVSMPAQSGRIGKKHRPALDDSSSTCSTDSLPSVAVNGSYKVSNKCESLSIRGKYKTDNERSDKDNYTKADCSAVSTTASETKNIIESLQQRVQSLEQTVAEKDQEIAFLQRQLSSFQHQIGGDKSCKQQDMTANHCNARTSGLSVSKSVDDDKGKSLGMQADESAVKHSSSSCSVELQARCSIPKDLPTESGNLSGTNFTLNNLSVSIKQLENPPVESCNLNGSGLSLNKPVSVSLKHHLQKPSSPKRSGEMDNTVEIITTGSVQIETSSVDSHSARGTIAYHDRSRPSSAPLFPVGPRPNISAALTRPIPSLSRSTSARLDNGVDPMTFSSSSLSSTPPVSPSYRNAAAGKMRGSSTGHFPRVVSSAAQTGVCVTQPLPSSSLCTTATTSSNPYKVCVSCPESLGRTREDASPSSSTSISSHVSTPRASMLNGSASDQTAISGVEQGGTQMGFMFGTIMRDPLNRNTSQELAQDVDVAISGVEDISCKQDQQQQQQRFLGQYVQQQRMSQNLRASQVHSEQDNLDNRFPHYSQDELRTRQSYKNIDAANSNKRAVPGLSEEFPHLDIINYLLDEEQNMGKAALSAMLHNPHEQKLNRQFSLPVLQGPKFDLHNSGRFDRYAPEEDGSFQLACSSDWCPPGLSESMQILPPYVHSSPTQYIDQHGGPLEEVPSHNWSMYSADMPGNSIMNNGHGPVGPPMGYSMQDHHISAGHCSNFTVGPNGYAYF